MIVTVFRSCLDPANAEEYYQVAARMSELAKSIAFYTEYKLQICKVIRESLFRAKQGEKVAG